MSVQSTSQGGWPAGWMIAAGAGLVATILARWLGDSTMTAAVLVGLVVLVVYIVLLGMFWTAPVTAGDHGHDHGHAHDHDDHTTVLAAAPVAAQVVALASEVRPLGLPAPRGGVADALQTIEGIGPVLEKLCQELGIYHFDQIAGWGPQEVAWMDNNLQGFKGRVSRDRWVRQASLIDEIGLEAFTVRAGTNDY